MSHFESLKNVKKIQELSYQAVRTLSYFACTRPSDFYFRMMALTEGQIALFVKLIQMVQGEALLAVKSRKQQ